MPESHREENNCVTVQNMQPSLNRIKYNIFAEVIKIAEQTRKEMILYY